MREYSTSYGNFVFSHFPRPESGSSTEDTLSASVEVCLVRWPDLHQARPVAPELLFGGLACPVDADLCPICTRTNGWARRFSVQGLERSKPGLRLQMMSRSSSRS